MDAVVIGAGGMGAATAWRLAVHGRSVVLLEQFAVGHRRGSSHGQTRIFRLAYRDSRYTALAARSIPLWQELEDASGERLLERTGSLDHGTVAAIDQIEANLRGHGRAAERLTPGQAQERWPSMVIDTAAVFSPDGGRVFADRTVAAAARVARQHGVRLHEHTTVEHIEPMAGGVRVHAAGRSWQAGCAVIAAGAWVSGLIGHLVNLPRLRITCQQPGHFAIRDGCHFPSFIHHTGGRSDALGFGAYGLASPGEGVKLGLESTIRVLDSPDAECTSDGERPTDPRIDVALREYAERWLPGADSTRLSTTTCLFTETADSHFVVDRAPVRVDREPVGADRALLGRGRGHPAAGPIIVCSPCSGHGFKFVPIIGEITARLAMGEDHGLPAWRIPQSQRDRSDGVHP